MVLSLVYSPSQRTLARGGGDHSWLANRNCNARLVLLLRGAMVYTLFLLYSPPSARNLIGCCSMSHPLPPGHRCPNRVQGVPRSFTTPKPDLILLNEGTNDGCDTTTPGCKGSDITSDMTEVLKNLTAACPGVPIGVLNPFNGGQTDHLQAAVAATGSADVHFVPTV